MSASTTWPAVRTKPAPAPARKRATMNSGKRARFRAPEIAERRDDASDRESGPAPEPVAELTGRHGDDEARQPVDGDREADRGGGDAERLRVERERRHHPAEAELVDGDEDAHPDEDPPLEGPVVPPRFRPGHGVTPFVRTSSPRFRPGDARAPLADRPASGPLLRGPPDRAASIYRTRGPERDVHGLEMSWVVWHADMRRGLDTVGSVGRRRPKHRIEGERDGRIHGLRSARCARIGLTGRTGRDHCGGSAGGRHRSGRRAQRSRERGHQPAPRPGPQGHRGRPPPTGRSRACRIC